MRMSLNKKNILLLSPKFFGYELEIKHSLEMMGASVDFFDVRPGETMLDKILLRINTAFLDTKINLYYENLLNDIDHDYDYIFVIKGEGLNRSSLIRLRKRFRNAKFVYYTYDSVRNSSALRKIFDLFDSCFSFDHKDCEQIQKFRYEPLFYIEKYSNIGDSEYSSRKYDFSFIGTIHADRYTVISKLRDNLGSKSKSFLYFYHPSRFIFKILSTFNKHFSRIDASEIHFRSLSSMEIAQVILESRCIVDIHHPYQVGLTIRTIEMLGAKRKLITTNKSVVDHDFFRPENIYILDRNDPKVDVSFFTLPYHDLPQEIYARYRIDSWLNRVLTG
jgi:hypothetical protein